MLEEKFVSKNNEGHNSKNLTTSDSNISNKIENKDKIDNEISIQDKISEKIGSFRSFFRKERLGFIYCLIAQFLWTSNSVYLKFLTQYYNTRFKNKTFLFSRGLAIILISYILGNHYDGKIYKITEFNPKIKKCLLARANVSFFSMCLWLVAVYYLRITTCQIISTIGPIIQIYFGVIFLAEKYYSRYTMGIILGIVGSCIIILNENKLATNKKETNSMSSSNVFIGITSILFSIFLGGVLSLVNKIMAVEKISLYTQLFYFGIFHCLYSFLWMLFTMDFDYTLGYFFLSALQACLFFLGNYFNYLGLKIIDLSKTSLIQYTKIVIVFLLGSLVLGEKIFFSDIVGSTIIVSFMIYHVMNPIK